MDTNDISIVFLAANPWTTSRLSLDEEIRSITLKLSAVRYRDHLKLTSCWAIRPDDLLSILIEYRPAVVHFSGHGSKAHEIILQDDAGAAKTVSSHAIGRIFKSFKNDVKLVVLNACYTEGQASAIVEHIDFAIGMSDALSDASAIIFSSSLYRALGSGYSVQDSFDQAVTSLLLDDNNEDHIPQLLIRNDADPSTVLCQPAISKPLKPQLQERMLPVVDYLIANLKQEFDQQLRHVMANEPEVARILGGASSQEPGMRLADVLRHSQWPASHAPAMARILRALSRTVSSDWAFQIERLSIDLEAGDVAAADKSAAVATSVKNINQHAGQIFNIENQIQHGDWIFGKNE